MLRGFLVFAVLLAVTPAAADNRDRALKLFEDSDKAYKSGNFEQAAKLLHEAYGLYPEPILLYNLAKAQEGLGDTQGAVDSYERYLKEGKEIPDRGAVERKVATLKAQLDAQAAAAREAEERRRREEEARRHTPPPDDRTTLEIYGPWFAMGGGVGIVSTGIVFGVLSSTKHDDAIVAAKQRDAADLQHTAEQYSTVANVLFVVGALVTIGGGAWEYYEWGRRPATTAQLKISPTGVALEMVFP